MFYIRQEEDENLEDYIDRFILIQKWCRISMDSKFIEAILLRGILDSSLEALNLMEGGNICKLDLGVIIELYHNYCRNT